MKPQCEYAKKYPLPISGRYSEIIILLLTKLGENRYQAEGEEKNGHETIDDSGQTWWDSEEDAKNKLLASKSMLN